MNNDLGAVKNATCDCEKLRIKIAISMRIILCLLVDGENN